MMMVEGERYEYETNCLLYCKDYGICLTEVEIETIYENGNASSHFNPLRDSLKIYAVIIKYMCSSLLSVFIDYAVFGLLSQRITNVFAVTYAGRVCAAIINFAINKKYVFKEDKHICVQALRYVALLFMSGTLSALLLQMSGKVYPDYLMIRKILIEVVLFFFNFYIQKNFVFRKSTEEN